MKDDIAHPKLFYDFNDDEKVFKYGANFRSARKKAKLTQIEAAKQIGIAVNSLRLYESDKRTPSLSVLFQMADVYAVTLDFLFTGKEFDLQDSTKTRLLNAFTKLNYTGKMKAAERVEELAEIRKYLLPVLQDNQQSSQPTPPAQEGNDTHAPENSAEGPQEPPESKSR